MTATKLLIVLVLFICLKGTASTIVNKCGSGIFPDEVLVDGCEQSPCIFVLGRNTSMTLKFRAPRYLDSIKAKAKAILFGGSFSITYPLDEPDACVGITNTPCPIAANEKVEYTYAMFLNPTFGKIDLLLEFSLVDTSANSENIVCFNMDINVLDA